MYNTRRVEPRQEPVEAYADDGQSWQQDPLVELARLIDEEGQAPARHLNHEELADALAAEFALDQELDQNHLTPVEFPADRRLPPPSKRPSYDLWDDAALAQLPDDFDFMEDQPFNDMMDAAAQPPALDELPLEARPSRLKSVLLAAVVIVAAAGGAAGFWIYSGKMPGFSTPQLVQAPTGPYKIVPAAGDTIDEPVDTAVAAVFDPTSSVPAKNEERLVARTEAVADLPGVTPQVNRVVLPNGDEVAAEPVAPVETGPRRVRTVLVKPDGTIIDSPDRTAPTLPSPTDSPLTPVIDAATGGAAPSAAADDDPVAALQAANEAADGNDIPGETANTEPLVASRSVDAPSAEPVAPAAPQVPVAETIVDPVVAATPEPLPEVPVASLPPVEEPAASLPAPEAPVAALPPADVPAPEQPLAVETTTEVNPDAAIGEPVVAAPPKTKPSAVAAKPAVAPVKVKTKQPSGPIDLAAASAAPATDPVQTAAIAPAASGGAAAYVQVSSQKSEAAARAAFESLQRKYPGVLGGASVSIQQADLGAKGIYYRARIATGSGSDAVSLCQSLKAAGGDCIITKK